MSLPLAVRRPIGSWVPLAGVTVAIGGLVGSLHMHGGASVAVAILVASIVTIGPVLIWRLSITTPGGLFGLVMFTAFGLGSLTWLSIPSLNWGLHQSDVAHALY